LRTVARVRELVCTDGGSGERDRREDLAGVPPPYRELVR